jgi:DMSO/TMAO reductase YedYZ heme-binding membrane subunit
MAKQIIALAVVCCLLAVAHASVAPDQKKVSPVIATAIFCEQ